MMMNRIYALLFFAICIPAFPQNNLQTYTPSILFIKGDWEFKSFQNLYTQSKVFSANGNKVSQGNRQNYFTSINQFLYGISDRLNIGVDLWLKNVSVSTDNVMSRTAVTGFGPKIKIVPFRSFSRLSIQSAFLFPLAKDLEGRPQKNEAFLETDASLWLSQIFFDLPIGTRSQLFFQQAFWFRVVRNSFAANNFMQTQTSFIYSYFLSSKWTIYGLIEYFPTHYDPDDAVEKASPFFSYFAQSGIGTKYQLILNLIELELLYTNFLFGSEGHGAGETINIGFRFIHQ